MGQGMRSFRRPVFAGITGLLAVAAMGIIGAGTASAYSIKGLEDSFSLDGSNGYSIGVTGQPVQGSSAAVSLTASKPHQHATYFAASDPPAVATKSKIVGDYPTYGTINVKFHAKKTVKVKPPKGCTGDPAKAQVGTWKGTIKFTGEDNYTAVNAKSAKGRVMNPNWKCKNGKTKAATVLSAYVPPSGGIGPARYQFTATQNDGSSKASFVATSTDLFDGPVAVMRTVFDSGPAASTFTYDVNAGTATVTPPSPFTGTGNLNFGSVWNGSLKVDFPGESNVSLTGPDWVPTLSHQG